MGTTQITFPSNPKVGDDFIADNGSTYIWTGSFWSSALASLTGRADPIINGGDSTPFDAQIDNTLDGNEQHIIGAN
jgi:hypothetical protein